MLKKMLEELKEEKENKAKMLDKQCREEKDDNKASELSMGVSILEEEVEDINFLLENFSIDAITDLLASTTSNRLYDILERINTGYSLIFDITATRQTQAILDRIKRRFIDYNPTIEINTKEDNYTLILDGLSFLKFTIDSKIGVKRAFE